MDCGYGEGFGIAASCHSFFTKYYEKYLCSLYDRRLAAFSDENTAEL
jgi:hypothetical protein